MQSVSAPQKSWRVARRAPHKELQAVHDIPLIAQLLYNRGVRSREAAEAFLNPKTGFRSDPFVLPGMEAAVKRLGQALSSGETIAIYGDFDVDGITSSALLTEGLRSFGAKPIPYIPHRVSEGHGLNLAAIQVLRDQGVSLILTGDCGISSYDEVAAAADLGIDVVICDHHEPLDRVPDAVAVVDPKLLEGRADLAQLAAVGVAYKLIDGLSSRMGRATDDSLLEFVALGTVADMAPMGEENRNLVATGLDYLNRTSRPGLRELVRKSGFDLGEVDVEAISFGLAPRINAVGRLDHAAPSYNLLVSQLESEAQELAEELTRRNLERQQLTREIMTVVEGEVGLLGGNLPPILILAREEFLPGVIGLAAGRLADRYHRPAIVCQIASGEVRGSCRSVPDFDMIGALKECEDLFIRYGGHAQAAGFTLNIADMPELEERLLSVSTKMIEGCDLTPRLEIDAEVRLSTLNTEVMMALTGLEPHGIGNRSPIFLSRNIQVDSAYPVGADGQHTRLRLKAGAVTWSAIAFDMVMPQPVPTNVDVVFTLTVDRWNGRRRSQLRVIDLMPAKEGLPGL